MRSDAYSAREIPQRMIDPTDEPSALPANLPYPHLQQVQNSGMKTSQSMQSVSSTLSGKRGGFFSNIGKKSSKKESTSLGPPQSSAKKDVRGLPISSPSPSSFRTSSPRKSDDLPRAPAPSGPRGPRSSFTPPPPIRDVGDPGMGRSSLDTGLQRLGSTTRTSLDGHQRSSPVRDEDLKNMSEVLPHADRGVLRGYLARYGDQMQAIG